MADSSPLLASLLMGQRRRVDPIEAQRKYGQELILKGGSTAPLASGNPLEGLARALQGGLGGVVAGLANRQEEEKGQKTIEALGKLSGATTQAELTEAIKGSQIDPEFAAPLMAQILQSKMGQFNRDAAAGAFGTGLTPAAPGTPGPGLNIDINRRPLQQAGAAPPGTIPPEWEPHIAAAAQANNLPPDLLKRLLLTESGGKASAVSPAGAGGPAQLMPGTAGDLGVQNRFDPAAAIPGGATYLKQQMDKYGNLPHALAAYNWGPGNVDNWLKAGGDASKLPAETQAYIAKVSGGAQGGTPGVQVAQGDAAPQTAQAPSATSQPPEIPRPQPTPEQIQRYKTLLASPGGMTLEQANQALNKEIHDQWQMDKQRALAVWQDQQQSKRLQEGGAQKLGLEGPMTFIKDRMTNFETKVRPAAQAALDDINVIHQTRQVLDSGAFTGTGADAKLMAAKIGEQLGIPSDQAQNTQVLASMLAKRTIAGMGGSLGTGVSNADVLFMKDASGGKISLDEGALRRILDISERQSRYTLKKAEGEAARVKQFPGMGQFGEQTFQVDTAPSYEDWSKANPAAQAAPAQAVPERDPRYDYRTDPETGKLQRRLKAAP